MFYMKILLILPKFHEKTLSLPRYITIFCPGRRMYMYTLPAFMEAVLSGERQSMERAGMFQVGILCVAIFFGGNFPGGSLMDGNFPGGSLMDGNFPGGNFPRENFLRTVFNIHSWQDFLRIILVIFSKGTLMNKFSTSNEIILQSFRILIFLILLTNS